jgi:hypothetical protein
MALETPPVHASQEIQFGEIIFVRHAVPFIEEPANWRIVPSPFFDIEGYNRFCLDLMHGVVNTPFALTVQADSFVANPSAWDDEFLNYDYVGSPWPAGRVHPHVSVGNSGFCLRSKRLLELTRQLPKKRGSGPWGSQEYCLDDQATCLWSRPFLEKEGIKFAPVRVALKFGFERPIPGMSPRYNGAFGVHLNKA